MCGLFGWKLTDEALEDINLHTLAAVLAHHADRRGDDSWGVALALPDGGTRIVKATGSIRRTCRVSTILAKQVIGHTRKATTGAVTVPNAHPFHIGKIIGAHNGFVHSHGELNKELGRNFEVDSQHIFAHLDEGKELTTLSGSGTVTYTEETAPQTIYFGRGQASDLAIYGVGKQSRPLGLVWGSVGLWVMEALEMAGNQENFLYTTVQGQRYFTSGYELYEDGPFPLSTSRTGEWKGGKFVLTPQRTYDQNYSRVNWQQPPQNHEGDDYWKRYMERNKGASVLISRADLDHLPDALKKNPEVDSVALWQDKETTEASTQCDGCRRWGERVTDYEDNAGGIVKHATIDQHLCFQCAAWWGTETSIEQAAVPALQLNMDERLRK